MSKQIQVSNDGHLSVPGVFNIQFNEAYADVSIYGAGGYIKVGEGHSSGGGTLAKPSDNRLSYKTGSFWTFDTIYPKLDVGDYYAIPGEDSLRYRKNPINPYGVEFGGVYVLEGQYPMNTASSWKLETELSLKHSNITEYQQKNGAFSLEVIESEGIVASFTLNTLTKKVVFKVGSIIIFESDFSEPYKTDGSQISGNYESQGIFLSKWDMFEGGIRMEKEAGRYTLTINSKDNQDFLEVYSAVIEEPVVRKIVAYAVHFGTGSESQCYDTTIFHRVKFTGFAGSPFNIAAFFSGDKLTVDTNRGKVFVNGVQSMNNLSLNSNLSSFKIPPGDSIISIKTNPDLNNWTAELEIEEFNI